MSRQRPVLASAILLLVWPLIPTTPPWAQDAGSSPRASQVAPAIKPHSLAYPRQDLKGLPNFARVSEALYRGAQPTREGFARLKALGVRTIVDLRDHHSDREAIRGLGFGYTNIPFASSRPQERQVLEFLSIVTDPKNQPVFVHCRHGADRTGMMVACYRMVVENWDRQRSLAELSNFGFHNIWLDIRQFLLDIDMQSIARQLSSMPPASPEPAP